MRSKTGLRRALLALAAALPLSAAAADDAQVKALEQRLTALEDRLAASEATVAAQKEQIERAALPHVGQSASGMDKFLSTLQIGGAVTTSYAYNFNDPDTNQGTNALYQFNTDHNSFSLDAVKLELGRPASEPGMAGFQIDLVYGENANIMAAGTPSTTGRLYNPVGGASTRAPGDTDVFVQEGYVSYNLQGTTFQLGKWETLLGYEVIDSRLNPNITHGLLFTLAIPLYHTGLLASGSLAEGVVWALGVSNGFNNVNDFGDDKGLLGRIGMVGSNYSLLLNGFYGAEQTETRSSTGVVIGDDEDDRMILDLIATFNPSDTLSLWANFDLGEEEFTRSPGVATAPDDGRWYGLALGGKLALTEKTSVALRGEYMIDKNVSRFSFFGGNDELDAYSATLTLAHKLTENLMGRMELRHDVIDPEGPLGGSGPSEHDNNVDAQQDVGIVEVTYSFD